MLGTAYNASQVTSKVRMSRAGCISTCVLLLALRFGSVGLSATEILLIKRNGVVILAADSLFVDAHSERALSGCKIYQTGDFFWSASGVAVAPTGFDPNMIV